MITLKIVAAPVPWAVDAGTPFIRVHASDEGPTSVRLLAEFPCPSDGSGHAECEVELVFTGPGGWLRATPGEHERRLDYARIPLRPQLGQAGYAEQVRAHLAAHGVHPCPFFFIVDESPWVRTVGRADLDLRHYLLLGDGMLWEFLARGFRWRVAA